MVSREAPYPPLTGAPMRMWQHVNVLARLGSVNVFSVGERPRGVERIPHVDRWLNLERDAFGTPHYPAPVRAIALARPRQFPTCNPFADGRANRLLSQFIDEVRPDVILLTHWHTAFPSALKGFPRVIVDAHNIESRVFADGIYARGSIGERLSRPLRTWRFERKERALFRSAARVWLVSEDDRRHLHALAPDVKDVVVWPNAVDVASYRAVSDGTQEAAPVSRRFPTLVFVGYFAYKPNEEAAMWLIAELLPAVRRRYPDARLLLVGKDPTPELLATAAGQREVVVTGTVPDVRPYLAVADLAVVPLTLGGGSRLKILESFAACVPVVSTEKGAEGIAAQNGVEILTTADREGVCDAVLRLLGDDGKRNEQCAAALNLVTDRYSWEALVRRLPQALG